ncbi:unnamed protein product [Effrenium voratum]|nr:unnamed protein product [Effrenium voratum]
MLRVLVIPWAQAIETALWPGHACAFPALEDEARTEVLQAYVAKTEDASHCHSLCESQGCKSFMRRKTSGECWLYQRRCAPIPRGEFDSGREVGDLSEAQRPFYRNGSELLLEDTQKIRIDDVAFGYEVLSNHMGLASRLFGVRASQDPMTLLQLQAAEVALLVIRVSTLWTTSLESDGLDSSGWEGVALPHSPKPTLAGQVEIRNFECL